MKIVQNALFSSRAARFGQIAFLSGKVLKIVTLVSNSLQKGNTMPFSWKFCKTLLSGHAQHVLAKSHFWAAKISQSSRWPQILSKKGTQCAFYENSTKHSFQVMRSTFWPNRIFKGQTSKNRYVVSNSRQNRKTVRFLWKFYKTLFPGHAQHVLGKSHLWASKLSKSSHRPQILSKKEKQCAFMKIVQNALVRSCGARFGQIAFLSGKVLKIVTLVSNSLQKGNTVPFSWKFYKTLLSGHVQHVLAKSHLWASKLSKSSHRPQILSKKEKQCAFMKIVQNALVRSCGARFG